ncbi:MAG: hypothetical protein DHS20C10_05940 [marine bacterium B5-7]|nr:MAG: hypothetical protein DHS20C10_05940 [marine bacterium B5-7]
MSLEQKQQQHLLNELELRLYVQYGITPSLYALATGEFAPKYLTTFQNSLKKHPAEAAPSEALQAIQRKYAFTDEPRSDEACLDFHMPWFRSIFRNRKVAREKFKARLKARIEAIQQAVENVGANFSDKESAPVNKDFEYYLREKLNNTEPTAKNFHKHKKIYINFQFKKIKRDLWKLSGDTFLRFLGLAVALIVASLQGIISFFFSNTVFGAPLELSFIIAGFAAFANLLTIWNDLPNTIIEIAHWRMSKGFNSVINNDKVTGKQLAAIIAFTPVSLGAGAAIGIATFASFMTGTHPIIHFFTPLLGANPAAGFAFAMAMSILIGIAIATNIHQSWADFVKRDRITAFKHFTNTFFKPDAKQKSAVDFGSRNQHIARNILTVTIALGLAAIAFAGTIALVNGWLYAGGPMGVGIPEFWNYAIMVGLGAVSRAPFIARGLVRIASGVTRFGFDLAQMIAGNRTIRQQYQDRLWYGLSHPVFMFGLVGALFYVPYKLCKGPEARAELWHECKQTWHTFIKYPWVIFGAIVMFAAVGWNAYGNYFIANPKNSHFERTDSAIVSAIIVSDFATSEGVNYAHDPADCTSFDEFSDFGLFGGKPVRLPADDDRDPNTHLLSPVGS